MTGQSFAPRWRRSIEEAQNPPEWLPGHPRPRLQMWLRWYSASRSERQRGKRPRPAPPSCLLQEPSRLTVLHLASPAFALGWKGDYQDLITLLVTCS